MRHGTKDHPHSTSKRGRTRAMLSSGEGCGGAQPLADAVAPGARPDGKASGREHRLLSLLDRPDRPALQRAGARGGRGSPSQRTPTADDVALARTASGAASSAGRTSTQRRAVVGAGGGFIGANSPWPPGGASPGGGVLVTLYS